MRLTVRTAAALLVAAGLLAYANSLGGVFVFDDLASLVNNPTLRDWRQAFFPPTGGITVSGRPVLNASFALSHALGGGAAWAHHVVNIVIHVGAGLALFGLVRRTLQVPSLAARWAGSATGIAFFTALLWELHPLQTESVTYLVQRAESLMGGFFLLTLYCYLRGATSGRAGLRPARGGAAKGAKGGSETRPTFDAMIWYALAVGACLLGVGTKEVAVAAPVLVLLHDRAFVAGSFRAAWRARRLFYGVLFATWIPLAGLVLWTGGNRGGTSGFDVGTTAAAYWLTQFEAIARYLALSLWPNPLVFEYGMFLTHGFSDVAPFALVVVPLGTGTLWALWRYPTIGFAGAWCGAILAPTSIMPGTIQMVVEHRMYLPLAAVLALAVIGLQRSLGRRAIGPAVAIALALGAVTARRNLDYLSDLTLWSDTVAKRPNNAAAHHGVAIALLSQGQTSSALSYFQRAVQLDPRRAEYRNNYAGAGNGHAVELLSHGRVEGAIEAFEHALRLAPRRADYLANYAGALAREGRNNEAITRYEEALRLLPDYADAHANLGLILGEQGRLDEAVAHGETSVRLAPGSASAQGNFGITLLRAGRAAEAADHLLVALRLEPASPEAHNSLGVALIQLGRAAEAAPHFEAALRAKPDYPQARDNLARLRALLAAPAR